MSGEVEVQLLDDSLAEEAGEEQNATLLAEVMSTAGYCMGPVASSRGVTDDGYECWVCCCSRWLVVPPLAVVVVLGFGGPG